MDLNSGSSATSQNASQSSTSSLDFPVLAKTLNFNLPIKLDRQNFINWRAQILAAIRALDLECFITTAPPPQFITADTDQATENPDYKAWRRTDQLLLCWLLSTIGEEVIGQVNHSNSSYQVWQILESLYAQTSIVRVLQLKHQLSTIKKGSHTISEYMQKIKTIGDSLQIAGHAITEYELILSALNGLGHEYDPVVVYLTHSMKTSTLQEVQYSLMMHETRIEQLNTFAQANISSLTANFATYNSNNQNRNNQGGRGGFRGRGGRGRGGRWNGKSSFLSVLPKNLDMRH